MNERFRVLRKLIVSLRVEDGCAPPAITAATAAALRDAESQVFRALVQAGVDVDVARVRARSSETRAGYSFTCASCDEHVSINVRLGSAVRVCPSCAAPAPDYLAAGAGH